VISGLEEVGELLVVGQNGVELAPLVIAILREKVGRVGDGLGAVSSGWCRCGGHGWDIYWAGADSRDRYLWDNRRNTGLWRITGTGETVVRTMFIIRIRINPES